MAGFTRLGYAVVGRHEVFDIPSVCPLCGSVLRHVNCLGLSQRLYMVYCMRLDSKMLACRWCQVYVFE